MNEHASHESPLGIGSLSHLLFDSAGKSRFRSVVQGHFGSEDREITARAHGLLAGDNIGWTGKVAGVLDETGVPPLVYSVVIH